MPFACTRPYNAPWIPLVAALLVGALLATGCDTSVRTFVPRDAEYFSVFGVLNPAADTQWIRVDPLADSVQVGSPPDIDATVTLERLGTGRTVALRDSFMEVEAGNFVHNFWTTEPIVPGGRYRLRVERSDGGMSQATTTVPTAPPTITYDDAFFLPCAPEGNETANTFRVTVDGVPENHLAGLWVTYDGGSRLEAFDHLNDAEFIADTYEIPVNYRSDIFQIPTVGAPGAPCTGRHRPQYALIAATVGGPSWPNFGDASLNDLARPDTFSNVENGHGLFEGVYSDTVRINSQDRPTG